MNGWYGWYALSIVMIVSVFLWFMSPWLGWWR